MGYKKPLVFAGLGMMIGAASVAIGTAVLSADAAPTVRQAALTPPSTDKTTTAVVTGPRTAPRNVSGDRHPAIQLASTRPEEAMPTFAPQEETLTVQRGDTLMAMLVDAGVDRKTAHDSIEAVREIYNPRDLRPGDEVVLSFNVAMAEDGADAKEFQGFTLSPDPARKVTALRDDDTGDFQVKEKTAVLREETQRFEGRIDSSLFLAATDAGVDPRVLATMIKALSYDVDFQRDIRKGDSFAVMYSRKVAPDGQTVGEADIQFLSMELSGERYDYYAFEDSDGFVDFYNAKGQSIRKALLRTPINGARLSSGFGKRKHPVLGYTKMHKGSDFAAPRGTPIYAAGDGVVERANRFGSYGNYVRIRHNGEWSTAYAHMKGFAKGMTAGKRVRQGDIIGYVGTTGRSTGPHLHYEVLKEGTQVNPMNVRFPAGKKLEGQDMKRFAAVRTETDKRFAALPSNGKTTVAQAD